VGAGEGAGCEGPLVVPCVTAGVVVAGTWAWGHQTAGGQAAGLEEMGHLDLPLPLHLPLLLLLHLPSHPLLRCRHDCCHQCPSALHRDHHHHHHHCLRLHLHQNQHGMMRRV
jgi:hypothetical protein